ncbi:double-strand break repair helicase AddA [Palleronia sp. LCG004]|uniref:double-strand break repair helicase AddA n=1 Tax=Palleronia sp. LCG004 TaxID=3079304 RepID=UPI002942ACE6|nr:double-strand break repair helicase AddA [Palleronia sp. LCG004]WOI55926.1 double-strand break repair helicase AddA [Palleronia sp. LCG004]
MNEATLRQIEAAAPDRSTWLAANAGSGKTRVLTDRVARLLLGGVAPQNILCLTYTKAAASEMQNRLFKRLGAWAMVPDAALRENLSDLGVPRDVDLAEARRLFAKAVETPGGLRIQTIHSFCSILLRRFPVEAGVSPQFTEMDDRNAELLRDDCLETLAETRPEIVTGMARILGGTEMRPFTAALVGARDAFRTPMDEAALRDLLDLPADRTMEGLLAHVFSDEAPTLLPRVARVMAEHGGKTDQAHAPDIARCDAPTLDNLETLERRLLSGEGAKEPFAAKIGKYPTKAARTAMDPEDAEALDALMERVEAARDERLGLVTLERNLVLQGFAAAYLPLYAAAKAARGWLDFDDLIFKARDLLTEKAVADWVLYRLDGGIDHILVDEAQDTSPAQWQVIEALAREVASGHGTQEAGERTLFVVGDKKQSIYSFQGADPEGFDRMHDSFAERLGPDRLQRLDMLHSFRSAPAILSAVDAVFADQGMTHLAFRDALPGRVDLWPLVEPGEEEEAPDFDDPVDRVSPRDATALLADHIANGIASMIGRATIPDENGERRVVHAGDVLILFRSRGALFQATIRACKKAGLPVAGADRLTLTSELAVKDIAALLSFLATPEDSLSLASALRSPLFGWSEQELYTLAAGRTERHLWQALRHRRDDHPATLEIIDDLRGQADYLRPYDLIERLMTRHRGRARLVGRLGRECEEAIDALLSQALDYERTDIPSLTGFLNWLTGDEIQIKRQSEGAGRNLRIMSVHGAKGLEAPIVILPETMGQPPNIDAPLWPVPGGRVLKQPKDQRPPLLRAAHDVLSQAQAAERDRLLYVAMTRAQFWLILCGAGDPGRSDGRWYGQLAAGLAALPSDGLDTPAGPGHRYQINEWDDLQFVARNEVRTPEPAVDLPDWLTRDAGPPPAEPAILRPSGLGGAKALPGETMPQDGDDALLRGTELHALLEHLPPDRPEDWPDLARRVLPALDEEARAARLSEVGRVLGAPAFRDLLARPAFIEVELSVPHPSGARIEGAIDRLIVDDDRVLAIDYKSNRIVPETPDAIPEGLLRQMGAYAAGLARIYPGKRVELALLWTATATLMPVETALAARAFAALDDLDAQTPRA